MLSKRLEKSFSTATPVLAKYRGAVDEILVPWGVIMDDMRSEFLFDRIAVHEFIWNEPLFWPLRIISDQNFPPDHCSDH